MKISRRRVIGASGTALTGLSLGFSPEHLLAQAPAPAAAPVPERLVDSAPRVLANLFLRPDGTAPEYTPREMVAISDPILWRYTKGQPPPMEFDYRKLKVKITPGGVVKRAGTLTFADLEALPRAEHTFLLQCGTANPRGIVKWTGVRFSDFADMLGLIPGVHYCRFIASDRFYADESMDTLRRPQVMLAWLMNNEPIPPKHGAPLRLIIPFRYGNRSVKAITEMLFATPGLPMPPLQG